MTNRPETAAQVSIKVFPAMEEEEIGGPTPESLLYARGYAVTRGTLPSLPEHWRTIPLADYTLSWDSRNPVVVASAGKRSIVVIGRCFDLRGLTGEPVEIGERLFQAATEGQQSLGAALYDLAGRYVVLSATDDGLSIESDATGMKGVYYGVGGGSAASHSRLAAELAGSTEPSRFGDSGWFGRTKAFTYPGNSTEFRAVRLLTPNVRLSLADGNLCRVHPRASPEPRSPEEAAQEILPLMRAQLEWLAVNSRPHVSLTAGLDSRVTLAATQPYRDSCLYFSYATSSGGSAASSRADLDFAVELARAENLDHQTVLAESEVKPALAKVMARNSRRIHSRQVAAAYREQLPAGGVHIRSNIYEIGRAFYHHGSRRALPDLTAERMGQLLVRKGPDPSPEIVQAFKDWMDETEYSAIPDGYDLHDMFYWELRMGSWMQAVLLESDIAHDTYTLINSRRILDAFLGVEKDDRLKGRVMGALLSAAWPALAGYPVNGRSLI